MKIVLSLAAVLALAVGLNVTFPNDAKAWCGTGWGGCGGAVLVPAPHPIPIKRVVRRGCVGCAAPVVAAPCGVVVGVGCGPRVYAYAPTRFYAYWAQPGYTSCFPGPGNCYWRRDCWYDSFGRRFCN